MNCVITNLHHYLFETLKIKQSNEKLKVWCDNTTRENKNYFLFSYLWILVNFGYFSKVNVGFMLVGHTHCDIDRCFGVWKNTLFGGKKQNKDHIGCLDEVVEYTKMNEIQKNTNRGKRFSNIVYEYDNWKKFLRDFFTPIQDITKYQYFEINSTQVLGSPGYTISYEVLKDIEVQRTDFPNSIEEIESRLSGCRFKMISDNLINNIKFFKIHLASCPECIKFWTDIEKEIEQLSNPQTDNFMVVEEDDDEDDPDYLMSECSDISI